MKKSQTIQLLSLFTAFAVLLTSAALLLLQPKAATDDSAIPTAALLPSVTPSVPAITPPEIAPERSPDDSNAEQPVMVAGQPTTPSVVSVSAARRNFPTPLVTAAPQVAIVPTVPPTTPPVVAPPPSEAVPNRILIRFEPGTSDASKRAYVERFGGDVVNEIASLDTLIVSMDDTASVEALPQSEIVVASEPDYFVSAQFELPPNDPLYHNQWALPAINAPAAWATLPENTSTIAVAIIDSGICADHVDLQGRLLPGYDFVEGDTTPQDEFGHGCAVAGIAAANMSDNIGIAGVAPNIRIMPLRVLNADGLGTYSGVAAAITFAADHGAQIINLSLGGVNRSALLEQAIDYALERDVLVIAAAGNTGGYVLYPAAYDPVIAVGAVDTNLEHTGFSASGSAVDVYAPGVDIMTTNIDGQWTAMTGTSFAAPHVAGIAALDKALGHDLVTDGGLVAITGIDTPSAESTLVVINPTVTAPAASACDMDAYADAEAEFQALYEQRSTDPDSVDDETYGQAALAYLIRGQNCYPAANPEGSGGDYFDDGGLGPDGEIMPQYVLSPWKWGSSTFGTPGGTVSYSFMGNGVTIEQHSGTSTGYGNVAISNLPGYQTCFYSEIRAAFAAWSAVANIDFIEVADNGYSYNTNGSTGDIRIGAHPFDNNYVLAHAGYPWGGASAGDLHFNSNRLFSCNTSQVDIGLVALHEIGHSIGLDHEPNLTSIMQPSYNSYYWFTGLAQTDIDGARAIYGVRSANRPAAPIGVNIARNGDFNGTNEWGFEWQIDYALYNNVLAWKARSGGTMAAVSQTLNYSIPSGSTVEMELLLGNSSGVQKYVRAHLHQVDTWNDMMVCDFYIPANTPLQRYIMRRNLTTSWANTRIWLEGRPADSIPDILMDEIRVRVYDSNMNVNGTQCYTPSTQTAWDFGTGGQLGWALRNSMSTPVMNADGSGMSYRITGSDPQMQSPTILNAAASTYRYVLIEMASQTDSCGQIFFKRSTDTTFVAEHGVDFTVIPDGAARTYLVDMAANAQWTSTIGQLRLDPACGVAGASTVRIKQIRLLPATPINTNLVRNNTFASAMTFWNTWGNIEAQTSGGALAFRRTSTANNNPGSIYQDMGYPAPANAPLEISMQFANDSSANREIDLSLRNIDTWTGALTCHFVLPPYTPLQTYTLRGRPATAWRDMRLEITADTVSSTRDVRMTNGQVQYRPSLTVTTTECISPTSANDLFINATTIPALPYYTTQTDIFTATTSVTDPPITGCGLAWYNTVWFRYTPAVNQAVTINTLGSSYDTVVGVYTGSEGSLTQIACNDDTLSGGQSSFLTFNVTAGTNYRIMVAKYGSALTVPGTLALAVQVATLQTPTLSGPWDQVKITTRQPQLSWSAIGAASSYEIQMSRTNPPTIIRFTSATNTYTPSMPLMVGATYYWRVRAVGTGDSASAWSTTWSFTIGAPTTVAPLRNLFTTMTPTLSWNRISWAAGYEVQVDTSTSFSTPDYDNNTLAANTLSVTITPLPNGAYYWRARARRADGTWGPWSAADPFTIDVP